MKDILISYDEQKDIFDSYALALKSLLNTLIRSEGVHIHSLDSRVKTRKSLENKIEKKKKYVSINNITDIVGIRIITHYADDVDKIAQLVEREFTIDKENSIDKRVSLEPEKFGYLSLHYIATLNEARIGLKEYSLYKDIKAEIQIRSILQHAWAEIEHDIGYKQTNGLPNVLRRSFSRLAGLLELADDEFIKIKDRIAERQQEVSKDMESGLGESSLDIVALGEFLNKSRALDEISHQIKLRYGITVVPPSKDYDLAHLFNALFYAGIATIKDLTNALIQMKEYVIDRVSLFGKESVEFYQNKNLPKHILLVYLAQILVALQKFPELELKFNTESGLNLKEENVGAFFEKIRRNITDEK
ncbi:hypothetical protein QBD22_003561 [Cronobacter muytjensii]|nr:hypothetical protein [Cronobacter muytjensii]